VLTNPFSPVNFAWTGTCLEWMGRDREMRGKKKVLDIADIFTLCTRRSGKFAFLYAFPSLLE
jgi:hypothetical protein